MTGRAGHRGARGWMRGALALACAGFVAPAAAQEPWRASYFPYVVGGPTDGLTLIGRYQLVRNAPYFISQTDERDVLNPLSFAGAFSVEGGLGTRGTRFLSFLLRAPGLTDGWRFHALLEARRDGRFGYYGLGPDTEPADNPPNDTFNRVHRTRYVARGEVSRRIAGPLLAAVAGTLERSEFSAIEAPSLIGPTAVEGTDAILRGTLVVDTRDFELVPSRGVLAEVGAYVGTNGVDTDVQDDAPRAAYTGAYVHLRGYVSPREGTVLAGRFALRGLSEGAPLSAKYMLPGWENDRTVLGGPESHRGFIKGRFGGEGVLLASVEVRHDLLNAGDFGAITALGFVDGGRTFEQREVTLTTDGWEVAYGAGLGLRILRSAILSFTFAFGGDRFTFAGGTGFSF